MRKYAGFLNLVLLAGTFGFTPQAAAQSPIGLVLLPRPAPQVLRMNTLRDQTISWQQPESTLYGYNGYCGETAWANMISMYTSTKRSPIEFYDFMTRIDPTPGTHAKTLLTALQNTTKNSYLSWSKKNASKDDPLFDLYNAVRGYNLSRSRLIGLNKSRQRYPLIVLLEVEKNQYHWVTVVDVTRNSQDGFSVVYNHQGSQEETSGKKFKYWWNYAGRKTFVGQYLRLLPSTGPYVYISPKVL